MPDTTGQGGIMMPFCFLAWGNWEKVMPLTQGIQEEEDTWGGMWASMMCLEYNIFSLKYQEEISDK